MTTDPKQRIQLTNPVHCLATGFGSGLLPKIPGTFGTLAAVPFYLLLMQWSVWALIVAVMIGGVVGIYLCDQTAKDMGVHDHGSIVWDEFIGFWLTMIFLPSLAWQPIFAGFIFFRFFDMVKPWPIRWLDRHLHGGFGIMLDDIVAGIFAGGCLWLGHTWLQWW